MATGKGSWLASTKVGSLCPPGKGGKYGRRWDLCEDRKKGTRGGKRANNSVSIPRSAPPTVSKSSPPRRPSENAVEVELRPVVPSRYGRSRICGKKAAAARWAGAPARALQPHSARQAHALVAVVEETMISGSGQRGLSRGERNGGRVSG